MLKRVKTTSQSTTGRNTHFKDTKSGRYMTRQDFVKAIKAGNYSNYHVRMINGVATPVSNPDKSKNNNLD
ncbi:DUF3892 domain-containing protein [Anaerococcus lactolyticus]|uniref:DUF3892 domain-containing protein n=1 Tax=Anaerococcus lactolyticus TaxID=33032 RepID=UPI00288B375B|nr:hypothetical protein [Anaerococcus lactolyticus]